MIPLPPPEFRTGGRHHQSDDDFLRAARRDAGRLIDVADLGSDAVLLDFGCGAARLAIGLLDILGDIGGYHGVDVRRDVIEWCTSNITDGRPHITFSHLDAFNARYNPDASPRDIVGMLPVGADFDVVYAYSVFSHLPWYESQLYAKELARVLRRDGNAVLTAFVEEDVPERVIVNPENYGETAWSGPLHCVLYERDLFERFLGEAGFEIATFEYGSETDGQSLYVLDLVHGRRDGAIGGVDLADPDTRDRALVLEVQSAERRILQLREDIARRDTTLARVSSDVDALRSTRPWRWFVAAVRTLKGGDAEAIRRMRSILEAIENTREMT